MADALTTDWPEILGLDDSALTFCSSLLMADKSEPNFTEEKKQVTHFRFNCLLFSNVLDVIT